MTNINSATDDMYSQAARELGRLKLPEARLRLRRSGSTKKFDVYDGLRRVWLALTPEEWVRQHFVAFMVERMGISPFRIANEVSLRLNGMLRRADTVVYDNRLHPDMVVEYKAPDVPLTVSVLEQVLRYNLVFNARVVIVTNGMDVYTARDGVLTRGLGGCQAAY